MRKIERDELHCFHQFWLSTFPSGILEIASTTLKITAESLIRTDFSKRQPYLSDFFFKSDVQLSSFFKEISDISTKYITGFGNITDFTRRKAFLYHFGHLSWNLPKRGAFIPCRYLALSFNCHLWISIAT